MNFIRKIFEGKKDEWVHKQFIRYGKGNYENKAMLEITSSKNNYKIKSSFEYSGEFAITLAEGLKGITHVTGGIISTKDLRTELGSLVSNIKQFAGVKTFEISAEMNKEQILDLFKRFPTNLILLSFKTNKAELKSKVKSPTSAKPGKGGEDRPKIDFCVLTTTDPEITKDLLFDVTEPYKKVIVNHTFNILSLTAPKEYENNLELARTNAIRKGRIIRTLTLDAKEQTSEKEFEA